MNDVANQTPCLPDPAAIFAAALSLWQVCQQREDGEKRVDLSGCYSGMDQFMREVMRVANQFEVWSCLHLDFAMLEDVWPYLLQDKFGAACLAGIARTGLAEFDETDCLRAAMHLRLPIKLDDKLPVPISLTTLNPISGSSFREFRIQTVRDSNDGEVSTPYCSDDDPFDDGFGFPYFGLYGIGRDELLEHIADRATYSEAVSLAGKLAPGIEFPSVPVVLYGSANALK